MFSRKRFGFFFALALSSAVSHHAAALNARVEVTQRGNFTIVGNTLGHDCNGGAYGLMDPTDTVGDCGVSTGDDAPDVYWRIIPDAVNGEIAQADVAAAPEDAVTRVQLDLPAGAQVTQAFLYWGSRNVAGADLTVALARPGVFQTDITAIDSTALSPNGVTPFYHSVADITSLVQQNGSGIYQISGVAGRDFRGNLGQPSEYMGWWLVVLFQDEAEPVRRLSVFDGLDRINNDNIAVNLATLDNFRVANNQAATNIRLGVVAFEGDYATGDAFSFNGTVLGGPFNINPADNWAPRKTFPSLAAGGIMLTVA